MDSLYEYLITLLSQIGGGPGPAENNLVRFGLAATLWGVLFLHSWTRRRQENLPREQWLLFGFGFAFLRDIFMFAHLSIRMITGAEHDALCTITVPLEHTLTLLSVVMIAGAFLRYILNEPLIARRNLEFGLSLTGLVIALSFWWWPQQLVANPEIRFHATWLAWLIHSIACLLIGTALFSLVRARGWVSLVVVVALSLLFISEFLVLVNLLTARVYSTLLCPLGNTLYISSIPVFGFVYLREQAHEKRLAEEKLHAYRNHLEELVEARTAELTAAHTVTAAMHERQRIAAEMHDGLAQTLSYLGLKTDQVVTSLGAGDVGAAVTELDSIHAGLKHATTDVRRTIYSLQQQTPPQHSLRAELERFAAPTRPADSAPIALRLDDKVSAVDARLPPDAIEQIGRIVQEAVANADRHATAARIEINAMPWQQGIEVSVSDDGCGFDQALIDLESSEHFGLSIMQARAARINARLTVDSTPGQGTTVSLRWQPDATQHPEHGLRGSVPVK